MRAARYCSTGVWLERGRIDGSDRLLMDSKLGLAGHSVIATMWLADGVPLGRERSEQLIDSARSLIETSALPTTAGVSAPDPSLLVLRAATQDLYLPSISMLVAPWIHCSSNCAENILMISADIKAEETSWTLAITCTAFDAHLAVNIWLATFHGDGKDRA